MPQGIKPYTFFLELQQWRRLNVPAAAASEQQIDQSGRSTIQRQVQAGPFADHLTKIQLLQVVDRDFRQTTVNTN